MSTTISELLADAGDERLAVATSLLLYELAASDRDFALVERETIVRVMGSAFGVTETRVGELIRAADVASKSQRDLHGLALAVKREVSAPADRRRVVEVMWRVVLADGAVAKMEELLANSVSSLLGVGFQEVAEIRREILEG